MLRFNPEHPGSLASIADIYEQQGEYYKTYTQVQMPLEKNDTSLPLLIEVMLRICRKETLPLLPHSNNSNQRPVFIVGMSRSGASLTEQILGSHPDVFAAGELNDINDLATSMPTLLRTDKPHPACFEWLNQNTVDQLARRYLKKLDTLSTETRYMSDKMPHNFMNLGFIALFFPEARIIHCARDPRNTCLSIYSQHFNEAHTYASKLENIAPYYLVYHHNDKPLENRIKYSRSRSATQGSGDSAGKNIKKNGGVC